MEKTATKAASKRKKYLLVWKIDLKYGAYVAMVVPVYSVHLSAV